jgi:putative RNA 2'-phosphotransferase
MEGTLDKLSRLLSLILRHKPETVGLALDPNGWLAVDDLLSALARHGTPISRATLDRIVRENDKQRFAFDDSGAKIRANQGHSVSIDLKLAAAQPPEVLYHGTATRNEASIRAHGLTKQDRQHVHLSPDHVTATLVGQRHGKAIVLTVRSGEMHRSGIAFYQSDNGVWLVDAVPAHYIDWPDDEGD